MKYRMIAVDLDDTLLNEESKISARNRKAICRAVQSGTRFVIATGRMFKTSVTYLDDLTLDGDCPLINYHGALVTKARSREIVLHKPVGNDMAITVASEAEARGYHVSLFIEDELYIKEENQYSRYYLSLAHIGVQAVGSLGSYLKNNGASPTKMSIISFDGSLDSLETELQARYAGKLSILQSRPHFLEITDIEATKGQTLKWLAEREGIKQEEVIAFGDGHNDIDMISYAGLGVAVANARQAVIDVADLVTASNNDDGVAEIIERYVLNDI